MEFLNSCHKRHRGETTKEGFLEGVQDERMREPRIEIYLNTWKVYEMDTV